MFTIFITPQISDSPTAGRAYTPPDSSPLSNAWLSCASPRPSSVLSPECLRSFAFCLLPSSVTCCPLPFALRLVINALPVGHILREDRDELALLHLDQRGRIGRDAVLVELQRARHGVHGVLVQPVGDAIL